MNPNELISVIMPVRNGSLYIEQAVRSILNQSYPHFELIIIDDGSTDGTPDIIRSIRDQRIRLFCDGKAEGITARLNEGLSYAQGKIIARMDADDLAFPRRFEIQINYLKAHPELDVVAGRLMVIDRNNGLLGVRRAPELHEDIVRRPERGFQLAHPAFMGKASWFKTHKYHVQLKCEDQDLLLRSFRLSRFANVPEYILAYRETKLEPAKYAEGRGNYLRSLLTNYKPNAGFGYKIYMQCKNAIKHLIEEFAVRSGLGYKILRNRHMPATQKEKELWNQVLAELRQAQIER